MTHSYDRLSPRGRLPPAAITSTRKIHMAGVRPLDSQDHRYTTFFASRRYARQQMPHVVGGCSAMDGYSVGRVVLRRVPQAQGIAREGRAGHLGAQ